MDKCLSQGQTFDPSIFDSDESDEENAEERKKKEKENRRKKKQEEAAAQKQKKPRKHRIRGRRYYNDSDHDADESELASESEVIVPEQMIEAFTMPKEKSRILPARAKRNSNVFTDSPISTEEPSPKKRKEESSSLLKTILSQGSGGKEIIYIRYYKKNLHFYIYLRVIGFFADSK